MAKIKIPFNGTDYSIDESALVSAKDSLKTHLSTVMNGSGGGNTITWDGVVGDRPTGIAGAGLPLIKVSDKVFSTDELVGCTIVAIGVENEEREEYTIGEDGVADFSGITMVGFFMVWSTPEAVTDYECDPGIVVTLPEPGTYFAGTPDNYVQSLTFPSGSTSGDIIMTLDGVPYSVDSTKLSTATDGFVAHIETLKGGGSTETITWDGVVGDRVSVTEEDVMVLVKVSDRIFATKDEYFGCTLTLSDDTSYVFDNEETLEDMIAENAGGTSIVFCVASVADTVKASETMGISFPETGTYFVYSNISNEYTKSLTFPSASTGGDIKLIINGNEYLVDSTKLSDAIADLHEALGRLSE